MVGSIDQFVLFVLVKVLKENNTFQVRYMHFDYCGTRGTKHPYTCKRPAVDSSGVESANSSSENSLNQAFL